MLQSRHRSSGPVERRFLHLPHGTVHLRIGGDGPVVLALHESPRSSVSLLPVIDALRDRYTVVAMDTPGYGLSDPLPAEAPQMADFLDAIGAVLDGLGVGRAALYGAHTGAALATAFALREPQRVTALLLDGLSAFNPAEVEAFRTRYLEPYRPAWDGGHIMRLWSRVKDLYTWFPWYDQTARRRLRHEPQDIGLLERSALGFLQAADHYAKAYTLAAAFQPNQVLRDLKMPASVFARPDDVIADHLDRLEPGPGWEIVALASGPQAWPDALRRGIAKGAEPDRRMAAPAADGDGPRFIRVGEGWLYAHVAGSEHGPMRLATPDLPGDSKALALALAAAHAQDRVVVLSPPGCGWSDPLAEPTAGLDGVVSALAQAVAQLGRSPASLVGEGAGAVIAGLLSRRLGLDAESLSPPTWLSDPTALPTSAPLRRLDPSWDGAHLTAAWFQLRDLQLYATPPGSGPPTRRSTPEPVDLARLDRLFRLYVQGPECADLLTQVIDHLRQSGSATDGS